MNRTSILYKHLALAGILDNLHIPPFPLPRRDTFSVVYSHLLFSVWVGCRNREFLTASCVCSKTSGIICSQVRWYPFRCPQGLNQAAWLWPERCSRAWWMPVALWLCWASAFPFLRWEYTSLPWSSWGLAMVKVMATSFIQCLVSDPCYVPEIHVSLNLHDCLMRLRLSHNKCQNMCLILISQYILIVTRKILKHAQKENSKMNPYIVISQIQKL